MPFTSKAQVKKMQGLADQGKISQKTLDEFTAATPSIAALPEYVKKDDTKKLTTRQQFREGLMNALQAKAGTEGTARTPAALAAGDPRVAPFTGKLPAVKA